MKLYFKRPPDFNRLCLMSSGFPACYVFKNPFVLNRENIQDFISFHSGFVGKYVFDRARRQLALSPGDSELHRRIAVSALGRAANETMFGGKVVFEKSGEKVRFEVDRDSGYFDKPLDEDMKIAGEYLAELLRSINYLPVIEVEPYSVMVEGRLNYAAGRT